MRRLPGAPEGEADRRKPAALALAAQAGHRPAKSWRASESTSTWRRCLDVFRQPGDFIDEFQRSYGMDPLLVGQLGGAFISALQRTGVAATAKHFPGLGSAASGQNTDERPVPLGLPLRKLGPSTRLPTGKPSQRACGW